MIEVIIVISVAFRGHYLDIGIFRCNALKLHKGASVPAISTVDVVEFDLQQTQWIIYY